MCIKILKKNFGKVAGTVFLVVGIGHGARAVLDWPLLVGLWEVPIWMSAAAAVILLTLAFVGLRK